MEKKTSIDEFIHETKVEPFITRKDEYNLYKMIIEDFVLPSKDVIFPLAPAPIPK